MIFLLRTPLAVVFALLFLSGQFVHAGQESRVARAIFTTQIIEREPVDQILILSNKAQSVFFFTDLRHFEGQTIVHKWIYNDKVRSVIKFKVKGPRWRVFSRKDINPLQLGKWTVIVQDESGRAVKASVFRLIENAEQQVILPVSGQVLFLRNRG